MKVERKLNLRHKGWKEHEIQKAESILDKARPHDVHFSKMVFWSAIVVTIFGNLLVSLILIPFMIVLNKWLLYSIIIILAGTLGFLYNFLITDINHLEKKHHISAGIIVPLIAIANMVAMVFFSNNFIAELTASGKLQNTSHNPWIIAILFAIVFILPTLISKLFHHAHHGHKATIIKN